MVTAKMFEVLRIYESFFNSVSGDQSCQVKKSHKASSSYSAVPYLLHVTAHSQMDDRSSAVRCKAYIHTYVR